MPQKIIPTLQRSNPIKLLMMHTNQPNPLPPPLRNRLAELRLILVELDRVRIQAINLHRPTERPQMDNRRDPANPNGMRHGPVDEVHALAYEAVHRLPVDRRPRPVSQLEEAGEPGDGAPRDEEGARDEDGVEEVPGDLAVRGEALEGA